MRRLPPPEVAPSVVYDACVGAITNLELAGRFTVARAAVLALSDQYPARAMMSELHQFQSSPWGQGDQVVVGTVTKDELIALYGDCMAKRGKPGRAYYDQLMILAPLGKCPYCGFGQVSTLDHFIPKAHYPATSVLPSNLVPACTDCNKGKGAGILDAHNQVPHPYFAPLAIETDTWLHASVVQTSPVTATFSVIAPAHWPADLARRVHNFARDLRLSIRFAVEAATELALLSDLLERMGASQQIETYLRLIAQVEREHQRNTWKAALYEALAESVWYREGGFRMPVAAAEV